MKDSCWNCKESNYCFCFKNVRESTSQMQMNIDGDGKKGTIMHIYEALANACFGYKKKEYEKDKS